MSQKTNNDLVVLYQRIAEMTAPVCSTGACGMFQDKQYHCCTRQYCEVARKFALLKYNVVLEETGNEELPFMGAQGCTVLPHLRPLCSIHICCYSWARNKTTSPDGYVALRDLILKEAQEQGKWPLV